MNTQLSFLAKNGYKGAVWLIILLGASLIFGASILCVIFSLALLLWIILFRNPERNALHISENAFLAPIDGVITEINSKDNICQIKISNHFFDVGVIRSPIYIPIHSLTATHGIPLYFSNKKHFFNSEICFYFNDHSMILHPQLFHLSPINENIKELERGERMGFMKGEIILEIKNIETKINVGDHVKGGESVLGFLQ